MRLTGALCREMNVTAVLDTMNAFLGQCLFIYHSIIKALWHARSNQSYHPVVQTRP